MNAIRQYAGLPGQVYLLCVVRVITCMGMFIYPFLAMLLKTRLGFTELQIGQVMLLIAGANISGSLLSGRLSDRLGRKRVYQWSLLLGVVTLIAGGLVCESLAVIPCVIIVYFCVSMTMPAIAAMITDWSEPANRSECFSLMYLCTNIGFSVGPFIAGFLFYEHTPWIFWGQAVSFAAAAVMAAFFIHDSAPGASAAPEAPGRTSAPEESKAPEKSKAPEESKARKTSAAAGDDTGTGRLEPAGERLAGAERLESERDVGLFRLVLRSPVLTCFVICLAVFSLCYIQVDFLLPLQVENLFGEELGSRYFGMISAANGIVCVVATPFLVSLTKRRNQLFSIALAGLLYMVGFGGYALAGNLPAFIALVAVWTSGEILVSTGSGVYIAEHSPQTHRARFQSLYEFSRGVGKAFGPTAFGYYLIYGSIRGAWVLVGGICLAASCALMVMALCESKARGGRRGAL